MIYQPVVKEPVNQARTDTAVFLQLATLSSYFAEQEVCILFERDSQRSYLVETTAERLQLTVKHNENNIHALFGEINALLQNCFCFNTKLMNLDNSSYIGVL